MMKFLLALVCLVSAASAYDYNPVIVQRKVEVKAKVIKEAELESKRVKPTATASPTACACTATPSPTMTSTPDAKVEEVKSK